MMLSLHQAVREFSLVKMVIYNCCLAVLMLLGIFIYSVMTVRVNNLGEEACLQIYTVPKRSVVCEPTQEVKDELDIIKDNVKRHTKDIETMKSQLDIISLVKIKDMPREFRKNLTKNNTNEYITNITSDKLISHLLSLQSEMKSLHHNCECTKDFQQLVEISTGLLKSSVAHNNFTILEDKLTDFQRMIYELDKRLIQSELDLTKNYHDSEMRLMDLILKYHEEEIVMSERLTQVTQHLTIWEEQVSKDSRRISVLENKTKTIQKHESDHSKEKDDFPEQNAPNENSPYVELNIWKATLSDTLEEKLDLEKRTSTLEEIVAELQIQMSGMKRELDPFLNMTEPGGQPSESSSNNTSTNTQPQIVRGEKLTLFKSILYITNVLNLSFKISNLKFKVVKIPIQDSKIFNWEFEIYQIMQEL